MSQPIREITLLSYTVMKTLLSIFCFLLCSISSYSQYIYLDNNGKDCTNELTIDYTYENYNQGSHGSGFKIYKNGEVIRSAYTEFSLGTYIEKIDFINDSVGFVVHYFQSWFEVSRTLDYGSTWSTHRFWNGGSYLDMYVLNKNTIYMVVESGASTDDKFRIERVNFEPIRQILNQHARAIFYTDSLPFNANNFTATDTIVGEPLCPEMEEIIFEVQRDVTKINLKIEFSHILSNLFQVEKDINLLMETYPNPTSEYLYWKNSKINFNNKLVRIFDLYGKLVKTVYTEKASVDVSDIDDGIYIIEVIDNEVRYSGRFVKN